eukprot:12404904-Karenia_brevis.AAC.1
MQGHTIFTHNRIPIHYFDMPIQLLNPAISEYAFDRVHLASSRERTILHDLPNLDVHTYRAAMLPATEDNQHRNNVINSVATLSIVDQSALHRFNGSDSDVCTFCHQCKSSVHHYIWKCPHPDLVAARERIEDPLERDLLAHIDIIPTPLLYGLPPKMTLLPCGPWWANAPISQLKDTAVTRKFRDFVGMDDQYTVDDPMVE